MEDKNKKVIAIVVALLVLIVLFFFVFRKGEDFTGQRAMLQQAVTEYITETGCYPAIRKVQFGNPSPIDFQKIYPMLPEKFDLRDDLYYWITVDGKAWLSKTNALDVESQNNILTYDRNDHLHYYLYYYDDGKIKKEETREREIDISTTNYAISESVGRGLETPPINESYQGYEKHRPIVQIRDGYESLSLLTMMREKDIQRTPVGNMLATIGQIFTKEETWYNQYGFDLYGEKIEKGEYQKLENLLGSVKIYTEDGRSSHWIDLMNPVNVGVCYGVNWEIIDIEPIDSGTTPIPGDQTVRLGLYNTRLVTVKGGPEDNPDKFKEVISFTTQDGFSGLMYQYGEPFTEEEEEETIYDYRVRDDKNFPKTISYNNNELKGILTLEAVIKGMKEITETRSARDPDRLPEKIEYDEDDYYGTLKPVGDYETRRTSRGSRTLRKDVEKDITRTDKNFPQTIDYSENGYSGTLTKKGTYRKVPADEGDTKTVSDTLRKSNTDFPDYVSYDKDGYKGKLYPDGDYRKIGTGKKVKTVSDTLRKSNTDFPDYVSYDKDGYKGKLYPDGDYERLPEETKTISETLKKSHRDFPDYLSYDEDGFTGKLYKDGPYRKELVSGGTTTKTVTEVVEKSNKDFPDYLSYDKDGFTGKLYPIGEIETIPGESESKTVSETIERDDRDFPDYLSYDKDGFTGKLYKDGPYQTTTNSKTVNETVTRSDRDFPDYITYAENGYEGKLYKDGPYRRIDENTFEQDYKGSVEKEEFTQNYTGEVEKSGEDTFRQEYEGEVSKSTPTTYVYYQDYKGEVEKSGEDTFRQEYEGEVSKSTPTTYVYYQDYKGEVEKSGEDTFRQEYEGEVSKSTPTTYVYYQDYKGEVERGEIFEQIYKGEVEKSGTIRYEQDYKGEVSRTGEVFEQTYVGEVTRRVSGGSYTTYTQKYQGTIYSKEEGKYIGIYSGKVSKAGYYQLYQGILRKKR